MTNAFFKNKKILSGQTAVELAVFGAILVFVIGIIVRQGLNHSLQQNTSLRAMRLALTKSHEYSHGILLQPGSTTAGAGKGDASRNTATVILVEDRLTADNAKYGSVDRTPLVVSASGTHTRNLFMPIDPGENFNMPVVDAYVNGEHYTFTTAGLVNTTLTSGNLFVQVPNHPGFAGDWNPGCGSCFDLDRDGTVDVPVAERALFRWQWKSVSPGSIDMETGANVTVDLDGDLKEERIIAKNGNNVTVIDFQRGDFDFSIGGADGKPRAGFTNDVAMYTQTKNGTYYLVEEGRLFSATGGQFVREARKMDHIDVIQRKVQMSNNTERYCSGGSPTTYIGGDHNVPNPVRHCCRGGACNDDDAITNCFEPSAVRFSCYDLDRGYLFIRSRLVNKHGRKWITNVTNDPNVIFNSN